MATVTRELLERLERFDQCCQNVPKNSSTSISKEGNVVRTGRRRGRSREGARGGRERSRRDRTKRSAQRASTSSARTHQQTPHNSPSRSPPRKKRKGDSGDALLVHGARVRALCEQELLGERLAGQWDATVLVLEDGEPIPPPFREAVQQQYQLDPTTKETGSVCVVRCPAAGGGRLVVSATGPLSPYDDVRSIAEAMCAGVKRAVAATGARGAREGGRRIIVHLEPSERFPRAPLVALLAALEAIYMPLQLREWYPERCPRVSDVGVSGGRGGDLAGVVRLAAALEVARGVARDVGGGDPERMSPPRVAQYIEQTLSGTGVRVTVLRDQTEIARRYPLLAAVTRAADTVERHRGCVVYLEYTPPEYERTLMFVGKGVTYDTGGADIKAGGAMAGMSRDKCGAASIAGLFKALSLVGGAVKVVAALGVVRNSVGEESYVADEVLRSRRGEPVRVGNTDAEGRLVMADLLHEMAERAASEKNPHIYTVATLTGHAVRAVGEGYSIVLDNHCARGTGHAHVLQREGDALGDMIEVSTIRREDLKQHRGQCPGDAIHQADNKPSTALPRGHQGPAAFLLLVSGLHTGDIPYSHLDIAGSAGSLQRIPTAAPLLALAARAGLIP